MTVRPIDGNAIKHRVLNLVEAWKEVGQDRDALLVKSVVEKIVDTQPTLTPPNEPLTWEELKAETKINPVYSVKYGWIFPITVRDGQPYAQIWFFTSKGFAQTELFYHDTFYRRPPEGEEETKDVHMG